MQSNSVIHRVLDILLLFEDGREKLSIDEIAQELDLPKSTAYRLVRELQERGFIDKTHNDFQLGLNFLRLSRLALNNNRDIRLMALPSMQRIAEAVRESVSLMRLINKRVVCIESIEGQYALRVSIEQGRIQPLHAGASSRILLAALPEDEWENYLEFPLKNYTTTTLSDFDQLRENLYRVRQDGYAISKGEIDVGACALAVPLMNGRKEVMAALSIEAPLTRMGDVEITHYLTLLRQEAAHFQKEQL